MNEIHPTALVSSKAIIGQNVKIGHFSVVNENVIIGDNSVIEGFCEIGVFNELCDGSPLIIGKNSHIRSHSVFYQSCVFGDGLTTGHRVTVREKTIAGKGFQIGSLGDVQGHCQIGDYVKCHSNVHIGQKSVIGNYVWIFPYVVLTNDPHPPSEILLGCRVDDYAVLATMSVILPGVHIASDTLIGAGSVVAKNVESGWVIAGNPAKPICEISRIKFKDGTNRSAYPWRSHFHRGYPEDVINEWIAEFEKTCD